MSIYRVTAWVTPKADHCERCGHCKTASITYGMLLEAGPMEDIQAVANRALASLGYVAQSVQFTKYEG